MNIRCVAVFGGTGFLGGAIVSRLVATGTPIRIAVRHPKTVKFDWAVKKEHIESVYADVQDEASVGRALEGCDAVVNSVGLYVERGNETFRAVHELGAMNLARQSARAGVKALVHMSGIGADPESRSSYVRSRARGELLVKDAFPAATILRPSVLFGLGDKFLTTLIAIARRSPVLALFGAGKTKLQPVYVSDVAEAVGRVLAACDSSQGKIYELGGPRIYPYRDIVELVVKATGRWRVLMPMPFFAWEGLARLLMLLPNPPLTTDVVTLMRHNNVVAEGALTFADLGLAPTAMETVLPLFSTHSSSSRA